MDGNEELSERQLRVIPFLLGAPSVEEGCKRARVSKAAVYEWLKEETFRHAAKTNFPLFLKAELRARTFIYGCRRANKMKNLYRPRPLECHSKIDCDWNLDAPSKPNQTKPRVLPSMAVLGAC